MRLSRLQNELKKENHPQNRQIFFAPTFRQPKFG
jgi:hypothetical protein